MAAHPIQFPRRMKRGAKVKNGPCADLLEFPHSSVADFYARFMVCRYTRPDAAEYFAEQLAMGERFGSACGWTHADIDEMIDKRRWQLKMELDALSSLSRRP